MRDVREWLRASRVELLHLLRRWENREHLSDGLRLLRCRNVFSRRAVKVRVVLGWYVQCGGSFELPDVRRGEKHERGEDRLRNVSGREV